MPGCVSNVLNKFKHDIHNTHHADTLHQCMEQKRNMQRKMQPLPIMAKQCLNIQKVTGYVLYYARAVEPTV
jgi:hypothetical protein